MILCCKMTIGSWIFVSVVLLLVCLACGLVFYLLPFKQYFKLKFAGIKMPLKKLLTLSITKKRLEDLVDSFIFISQSGIMITLEECLEHMEAGGSVVAVARACVYAREAGIDFQLNDALALDLSGKDCMQLVKDCLMPKVLKTDEIVGISRDGIEVKLSLKVTVRCNVKRMKSGSSDETILARISEAVVSTIGCSENHRVVIEHPDVIADTVIKKDLDSGTIYQLLSLDVVSVNVGNNIHAKLQVEKAQNDTKIAIAKADIESKELEIKEQKAKIKNEELKAEVLKSEAEVPKNLAEAIKKSKFSVKDLIDMENIKADTRMRNAITESSLKKKNWDE